MLILLLFPLLTVLAGALAFVTGATQQPFDVGAAAPSAPSRRARSRCSSSWCPAGVIYASVYENTGRSVLAVTLLHFGGNFWSEFLGLSSEAQAFRLGLTIIVAAAVAWFLAPSPGHVFCSSSASITRMPLGPRR